jgi:hypothetical protein
VKQRLVQEYVQSQVLPSMLVMIELQQSLPLVPRVAGSGLVDGQKLESTVSHLVRPKQPWHLPYSSRC